ncbi:uncharacterized protein TrAFT101_010558 [Trichoderma asperellum]|uniref:Uncharacterized protein n=1 Tax=Trichoderma asperellum (strain ATCC 204424 / CBS 433.97 / NBRC 101777) TaxID=1042311 RepID=A0A2T3YT59_TRIA4|nr:hypothetical protein M441DRAFT_292686 [Trichoderma asperellum CBS 433.97]PTB35709.1 hypothetical protein M441DRAFT_292686 [Trichoderma asperellum CBS 433.97]UKZ95742.1 hypothetical protein TrAFT101_010558 [Trichoderma asperellum]
MDLFGILVRSFLVKAVDFDLRAFCFRWVKVFGTIFGEERYCEAFLGDYDQGKRGEREKEACSTLYLGIWNWDDPRQRNEDIRIGVILLLAQDWDRNEELRPWSR